MKKTIVLKLNSVQIKQLMLALEDRQEELRLRTKKASVHGAERLCETVTQIEDVKMQVTAGELEGWKK